MTTFNLQFSTFSYGEVANYINVFDAKYYKSAAKLKNLMVTPYGPLVRRNGSSLISMLEHQRVCKLEAFEDRGNTILMEFYGGNNYGTIRFYLNGESLIINGAPFSIHSQWLLDSENENLSISYDSLNKEFYIFSALLEPQILSFNEDYIFRLNPLEVLDGPYQKINQTETTVSLSSLASVGEVIIITASEPIFNILDSSHKLLRIAHDSLWGYGEIKGFLSQTEVSLIVKKPFHGIEPTKDFRFGAWGLKEGYPSLGTLYNGRLYCARSTMDKYSLWLSNTLEYNNFAPTTYKEEEVKDEHGDTHLVSVDIVSYTNALTAKISDGKEIVWLASNKDSVLIGALEGIFSLVPMAIEQALSPYNYALKKLSSQKSSAYAISTDLVTCYADIHLHDLYSIEILQNNLLFCNCINANCKHLFSSQVKAILVLDYPFKTLLIMLEDGSLLSTTFDINNDSFTYAWYSYKLGGKSKVLSMATSYDFKQTYLYLQVVREHQGIMQYSLEAIAFNDLQEVYSNTSNNCYLDSHFKRTVINKTISGLEEFEGERLAVLINNTYLEEHKVKNAQIILPDNYSYEDNLTLMLGYNYHTCYQSPVLNSNASSSSIGLDKKISSIMLNLNYTIGAYLNIAGKILTINSNLQALAIDTTSNAYSFQVDSPWQVQPSIKIEQNSPYQLTLSYVSVAVEQR